MSTMTDNALEQYVMQSTDERARRKLPPRECFDSDDDECPPPPRLALPDSDDEDEAQVAG